MIRSSEAASLDQRRKAAIVVRFLLSDGMRPPLAALPEDAQVALTREMGRLPLVDRTTLDSVIQEFADALEEVGLAPREATTRRSTPWRVTSARRRWLG